MPLAPPSLAIESFAIDPETDISRISLQRKFGNRLFLLRMILNSSFSCGPLVWGCLVGLSILPTSSAGVQSDAPQPVVEDTRYGLFNWLDHRSEYGQGAFPEPFVNDDSDGETGEVRMDWFHTGIHSDHTDELKVEYEGGFGVATFEAAAVYNWEESAGKTERGFGSVEVAARAPFFQYVSADRMVDTTFGAGLEVAIPTNTMFSQSTEWVPKIFNDTRLGQHFTAQTIVGYSALFGGSDDGIHTLEYGTTLGYSIDRKDLAIPGIKRLIPIFEVAAETQLNKDDSGRTAVTGNAGFRANLDTICGVQPRLGIGYIFPINSTAREDLHWGVVTSFVFEF